jgi:hypothetical protein
VSLLKEGQKSIRVVVPIRLYDRLKEQCVDHGDISRLVRKLLEKWVTTAEGEGDAPKGRQISEM